MKSKTTLTPEQIRQLVAQKQEENKKRLMARASKKITPEQGLYIKYRLKRAGVSGADIALEVGCTQQSISDVLSGKSHSQRIERVVAAKLGYSSWNAMVQSLREMREAA